jgi:hypothetical protein
VRGLWEVIRHWKAFRQGIQIIFSKNQAFEQQILLFYSCGYRVARNFQQGQTALTMSRKALIFTTAASRKVYS